MSNLHKAGTVKDIQGLLNDHPNIPPEVCAEALRLVKILDELYGADRDVDKADGGFVLIAETVQDIERISDRYIALDRGLHEAVDFLKGGCDKYLNAFFICNNEFGINIIMPVRIAPQALLIALPKSGDDRKGNC
ncbi:hypothetical protein FACS1894216_20030 [Synergistales bacterium]|nr:hypothetical protein FACS1894216_20030 [Synergistales bacterium]